MGQRNGCPGCCAEVDFDECEEEDSGTFCDDAGTLWHRDCLERVIAPHRALWNADRFDEARELRSAAQERLQ